MMQQAGLDRRHMIRILAGAGAATALSAGLGHAAPFPNGNVFPVIEVNYFGCSRLEVLVFDEDVEACRAIPLRPVSQMVREDQAEPLADVEQALHVPRETVSKIYFNCSDNRSDPFSPRQRWEFRRPIWSQVGRQEDVRVMSHLGKQITSKLREKKKKYQRLEWRLARFPGGLQRNRERDRQILEQWNSIREWEHWIHMAARTTQALGYGKDPARVECPFQPVEVLHRLFYQGVQAGHDCEDLATFFLTLLQFHPQAHMFRTALLFYYGERCASDPTKRGGHVTPAIEFPHKYHDIILQNFPHALQHETGLWVPYELVDPAFQLGMWHPSYFDYEEDRVTKQPDVVVPIQPQSALAFEFIKARWRRSKGPTDVNLQFRTYNVGTGNSSGRELLHILRTQGGWAGRYRPLQDPVEIGEVLYPDSSREANIVVRCPEPLGDEWMAIAVEHDPFKGNYSIREVSEAEGVKTRTASCAVSNPCYIPAPSRAA